VPLQKDGSCANNFKWFFKPASLLLKRRQKTKVLMSAGSEVEIWGTHGSVKPLSLLRKQSRQKIRLKFDTLLDVISIN
jgi:hypothetical protein